VPIKDKKKTSNESELNKTMKLHYKTTQCWTMKKNLKINIILKDKIKKKYQFIKLSKVNSIKNDRKKNEIT